MKKIFITCMAVAMVLLTQQKADACTGITLTAKDSARIVARTIEWGGSELNSQYVVVPRDTYNIHTCLDTHRME